MQQQPQYLAQPQEEEQQFMPQQIVAPPMPQNPDQDFFRYRIDGADILEELQHQLRGEVFVMDENGNGQFLQKFDRWVNNEGVNKILHIVYACGINKNVFLGNLTHEEIYFKCNMLKKKLARLMFSKYKDYGVNKEMRDMLITTVVNTIHSGLSRCEEGREADQLSSATQRHEIYSEDLKQKKQQGSIFNPLNWRGGRR
jgi:hypothetical protein